MVGQGSRAPTTTQITGIIGNAFFYDVRGEIPPQTYFNLDSVVERNNRIAVYARIAGDPRQVMPDLRAAVRRIDPNFVVWNMRTLDEQLDTRMANERMLSFLSAGFAVLATVLAIVGLHGVLVFQIANRTREIGIRAALGARRSSIVRLVAHEMVVVVPGGLAAGAIAAYLAGRYVQSQLFGVKADDPLIFAAAIGALLAAAAAATILPALRASRINPLRALKS
jgi:ABC-type antimicrobial peptide transport system permease subunit